MSKVLAAICFALLAQALAPAEARQRDDVMSTAAACKTDAGARAWLDCYYAATAPMRVVLKLAPLPPSVARKAANMMPGELGARDQVLSAAYGCTTITDDRAWLDCYYGAAQPLRSVLGLPPAPQFSPVVASVRPAESSFGEPPPPSRPPPTGNHIASRMAAYHFGANGIFTITLANGQVWQQIDGDTYHARLTHPPATYAVRITHGFFGSYNVLISGVPGLFRAHRVS